MQLQHFQYAEFKGEGFISPIFGHLSVTFIV